MTRRPDEMEFMGGCYVFPGGRVEKEDSSEQMLRRCRGLSRTEAQRILGNELSPKLALGHWIAGIRELFEEVGVLLCTTDSGAEINMELQRKLATRREALVEGVMDFRALLKSEGLYCDLQRLAYFSHRITPEKHSIRFDTRFYLARLPLDQIPLDSSQEVTESLWITPEEALNRAQNDSLSVVPPTLAALRTLATIDSWQSLCAQYQLR
ncbi:MAG: NUDIX hydrolase [Candidatus Binatia bacterium]